MSRSQFYERPEWHRIRYRVLRKYGFRCMACGRKDAQIHVDHIMPVSTYPELALDENNLQVLCRDCNLGKSDAYSDDHRPKAEVHHIADEREIRKIERTLAVEIDRSSGEKQEKLLQIFLEIQRMKREKNQAEETLTIAIRHIVDLSLGSGSIV